MKDKILLAAQEAFSLRIKNGSVSEHTKNSSTVAKAWMEACWKLDPDRIRTEVSIHPGLNQRIDVLDNEEMRAFEFKVSGKNATTEFYKDAVKAILWNEEHDRKIKELVFITEETWGRKYLDTAMPQAFIKYLKRSGLSVEIVFVNFSQS